MSNTSAHFTYVTLWTAFQHLHRMYDVAHQHPKCKDDALALRLGALNMGFFAMEAFLNHIIQALAPDVWKSERDCFAGRQPIDGMKYYGPIGKLKYVHLLCDQIYDENATAVQAAVKIKKLRDMMAHGRSYYDEPEDIYLNELSNVHPPTPQLFEIGTHDLLVAAVQHFSGLRCRLFDAAKQRPVDSDLGPHPDSCISGMKVISVKP
jgi:hypothetical protein